MFVTVFGPTSGPSAPFRSGRHTAAYPGAAAGIVGGLCTPYKGFQNQHSLCQNLPSTIFNQSTTNLYLRPRHDPHELDLLPLIVSTTTAISIFDNPTYHKRCKAPRDDARAR